jgi:hypothetical protein
MELGEIGEADTGEGNMEALDNDMNSWEYNQGVHIYKMDVNLSSDIKHELSNAFDQFFLSDEVYDDLNGYMQNAVRYLEVFEGQFGDGLRTKVELPAGTKLCVFTGTVKTFVDKFSTHSVAWGHDVLGITDKLVLDGRDVSYNGWIPRQVLGQLVNHSCEPTGTLHVEDAHTGVPIAFIKSSQKLSIGTELTIDYNGGYGRTTDGYWNESAIKSAPVRVPKGQKVLFCGCNGGNCPRGCWKIELTEDGAANVRAREAAVAAAALARKAVAARTKKAAAEASAEEARAKEARAVEARAKETRAVEARAEEARAEEARAAEARAEEARAKEARAEEARAVEARAAETRAVEARAAEEEAAKVRAAAKEKVAKEAAAKAKAAAEEAAKARVANEAAAQEKAAKERAAEVAAAEARAAGLVAFKARAAEAAAMVRVAEEAVKEARAAEEAAAAMVREARAAEEAAAAMVREAEGVSDNGSWATSLATMATFFLANPVVSETVQRLPVLPVLSVDSVSTAARASSDQTPCLTSDFGLTPVTASAFAISDPPANEEAESPSDQLGTFPGSPWNSELLDSLLPYDDPSNDLGADVSPSQPPVGSGGQFLLPSVDSGGQFLQPPVGSGGQFLQPPVDSGVQSSQPPVGSGGQFFQQPLNSEVLFFQQPLNSEVRFFQQPLNREFQSSLQPLNSGNQPSQSYVLMLSKSPPKESPDVPRHNVTMDTEVGKRGRSHDPNRQAKRQTNKQTVRPSILRKIAANEDTLGEFVRTGQSATPVLGEKNPKPKRPVEGRPKPNRPVEGRPKPKGPVEGRPKPKRPVEGSKGRGAGNKVSILHFVYLCEI